MTRKIPTDDLRDGHSAEVQDRQSIRESFWVLQSPQKGTLHLRVWHNCQSTSQPGQVAHPSSAYQQALKACKEIVVAVESLGGNKTDIVRVRMFVTHENDATEVARALKEEMGEVEPTATMILGANIALARRSILLEYYRTLALNTLRLRSATSRMLIGDTPEAYPLLE
ncbi:hypothetical protein F5141DRAFT_1210118 [Pisolithus sp. B1]|nr:hypothetical protein F5141DRAFT_1210118 [Pisolithus sp. B1]